MKNAIVVLMFSLLVACSQSKRAVENAELQTNIEPQEGAVLSGKSVEFTKQCPNLKCKSYNVSLVNSHSVLKLGINVIDDQLNQQEQSKLSDLIKQLELTSMKTEIIPGDFRCGEYSTEGTTFILKVKTGPFSQILRVYDGCQFLQTKHNLLINWFEKKYSHPVEL